MLVQTLQSDCYYLRPHDSQYFPSICSPQARSASRQLTSDSTLIFRRRRLGSWIPLRGWTNMHTNLYAILGTRVRLESRQPQPGFMYPFAALATLDWTCALDVLPLCVFQESLCSDIVKVSPAVDWH